MFIHDVCKALEEAGIPYAVVGGYAVALHGAIRGTVDVDIVIHWSLENLQKVEQALHALHLVSLLPIDSASVFHFRDEYIKNRHMVAWNFYDPKNPVNRVDVVINYDLTGKKVKTVKSSSGTIKILSSKDLIEMKKQSGRPQDIEDAKALEGL